MGDCDAQRQPANVVIRPQTHLYSPPYCLRTHQYRNIPSKWLQDVGSECLYARSCTLYAAGRKGITSCLCMLSCSSAVVGRNRGSVGNGNQISTPFPLTSSSNSLPYSPSLVTSLPHRPRCSLAVFLVSPVGQQSPAMPFSLPLPSPAGPSFPRLPLHPLHQKLLQRPLLQLVRLAIKFSLLESTNCENWSSLSLDFQNLPLFLLVRI